MSTVYKYVLDITAKNQKFLRQMNQNVRKIDSVDSHIKSARQSVTKMGSSLKSFAGTLGIAFSVGAIVNFEKKALNAYNVQAKAEAQLLTALKGRKDVQERLIRQAQSLQKVTLFGDEETIKAQALIGAFVKEESSIKKVIPLVQDLATAKNMDLAGSADLVAKTLGSSTNALSRYGIEVHGAVGSTERLDSLVRSLTDAFGGQARAAAKAGTGGLTQLKNAWGDLLETIGGGKSQVINEYANFATLLINATNKGIKKNYEDNKSEHQKFLDQLNSSSLEGLKNLRQGWKKQSDYYLKMWKDAYASGDKEARKHYSMQYDLTLQTVQEIDKEISKRKENSKEQKKSVSELEALKEIASSAKQQLTDLMNSGGKFHGEASAEDFIKKLGELRAKVKQTQKAVTDFMDYQNRKVDISPLSPINLDAKVNVSKGNQFELTPKLNLQNLLDEMPGFKKAKEEAVQYMDEMKAKSDAVSQGLVQGFSQIGTAVVNGLGLADNGFQGFIKTLLLSTLRLIPMYQAQAQAAAIAGGAASGAATGPAAIFTTPGFIVEAIATVLGAFASLPKFATGGIVPGYSNVGDKMLIRVNSGEEVLTRSDPRHILNGGGGGRASAGYGSITNVTFSQNGIVLTGRKMRILMKKEERRSKYLGS